MLTSSEKSYGFDSQVGQVKRNGFLAGVAVNYWTRDNTG